MSKRIVSVSPTLMTSLSSGSLGSSGSSAVADTIWGAPSTMIVNSCVSGVPMPFDAVTVIVPDMPPTSGVPESTPVLLSMVSHEGFPDKLYVIGSVPVAVTVYAYGTPVSPVAVGSPLVIVGCTAYSTVIQMVSRKK